VYLNPCLWFQVSWTRNAIFARREGFNLYVHCSVPHPHFLVRLRFQVPSARSFLEVVRGNWIPRINHALCLSGHSVDLDCNFICYLPATEPGILGSETVRKMPSCPDWIAWQSFGTQAKQANGSWRILSYIARNFSSPSALIFSAVVIKTYSWWIQKFWIINYVFPVALPLSFVCLRRSPLDKLLACQWIVWYRIDVCMRWDYDYTAICRRIWIERR
jgi:hypothetical protein